MKTETADGIDHGESRLEDCIMAVIERFEDGYVFCPMLATGESCDTCMDVLERRMERNNQ